MNKLFKTKNFLIIEGIFLILVFISWSVIGNPCSPYMGGAPGSNIYLPAVSCNISEIFFYFLFLFFASVYLVIFIIYKLIQFFKKQKQNV